MASTKKKKKSLNRETIEWVIFLGIIGTLYFTGLHVQVAGFLQGLILKTGLMVPGELSGENQVPTDFQFVLRDAEGEMLSLEELKGKTLFINFWASWCPPCVAEMPDINALYKELEQNENVAFLMVSVDEERQKALNFIEKREFTFPLYFPASPIPEEFRSPSIPTTFVVSPEGKIVVKKTGMASYHNDDFRNYLLSLSR